MKDKKSKLPLWQERLEKNLSAYADALARMDDREKQYKGNRTLRPMVELDTGPDGRLQETPHVWNITAENIESEIDSSIPSCKATPQRAEDRELGQMIEAMIRDEIDRLPMEKINDRAERSCKIQGGVLYAVEWDMSKKTHTTVGENSITVLHPKRFIPQNGVEEIEDMDYLFLRLPQTKGGVKRRYGVDVEDEEEAEPGLRGFGDAAEDMVTLEIALHRNEDGGIGRIAWVNDTVCEDLKDFQSRQQKRCKKCGQTMADSAWRMMTPTQDGSYPENGERRRARRDECAYCGSRSWETQSEDGRWMSIDELRQKGVREDVLLRLQSGLGYGAVTMDLNEIATAPVGPGNDMGGMTGAAVPSQSPAATALPGGEPLETAATALPVGATPFGMQETGALQVWVPYYKPNVYPIVLQRNVTEFGSFLGESDCDKLKDQQNTVNRLHKKMVDRTIKMGTRIAMPDDTKLKMDPRDNELWYMPASSLAQVQQYDFTGDLEWVFAYLQHVYEESRRILGITDSFQGRQDTTATSGKAKEFAAAQSAGRLESKRVLKKTAWAEIYERLFKNRLAYCEEQRPMRQTDERGNVTYQQWNSWRFLEVDEAGELWWNDQFRFQCDNASGLASNREAMWQEVTAHFQSGAFGNPGEIDTLLLYWRMMEEHSFPGAATIRALLEERKQELMAQQQMQMQMQQQQAAAEQQLRQQELAMKLAGRGAQ